MSGPNAESVSIDARIAKAERLDAEASALQKQVQDEYLAAFPKEGDRVKVRDWPRLRFGFHNNDVAGRIGVVSRSWPSQDEVLVSFPDVPVRCGECRQAKDVECARLRREEVSVIAADGSGGAR